MNGKTITVAVAAVVVVLAVATALYYSGSGNQPTEDIGFDGEWEVAQVGMAYILDDTMRVTELDADLIPATGTETIDEGLIQITLGDTSLLGTMRNGMINCYYLKDGGECYAYGMWDDVRDQLSMVIFSAFDGEPSVLTVDYVRPGAELVSAGTESGFPLGNGETWDAYSVYATKDGEAMDGDPYGHSVTLKGTDADRRYYHIIQSTPDMEDGFQGVGSTIHGLDVMKVIYVDIDGGVFIDDVSYGENYIRAASNAYRDGSLLTYVREFSPDGSGSSELIDLYDAVFMGEQKSVLSGTEVETGTAESHVTSQYNSAIYLENVFNDGTSVWTANLCKDGNWFYMEFMSVFSSDGVLYTGHYWGFMDSNGSNLKIYCNGLSENGDQKVGTVDMVRAVADS